MKGKKFIAKPELWPRLAPEARGMRSGPTPAENAMWEQLRDRRFHGFKFRRQHVVGRFIVDFICTAISIVLEIDGPIHRSQTLEDQARATVLENQGLKVLRFSNQEVLTDMEGVLKRLEVELKK